MSEETLVRGIVLAHGAMAEGMVDAVRRISGADEEALVPLSNEGRSPEELCRQLDLLAGDGPAVIFTDLHSGSCALAARLVCRSTGRRAVVGGANLPMLLEFVFHRDVRLEELLPRLLERGQRSVQALTDPQARVDPAVSG